jgi:tRNA G37 N-methylase Trm5
VYNFVEWHVILLNDRARVAAYQRAIDATVKPGDVVLDVGAGTGVMGLLACRAGAARVYAIEGGGMVEIARKIARANGFADRIVCVHGNSTQVELPERVDVAIADQTGRSESAVACSRSSTTRAGGFLSPRARLYRRESIFRSRLPNIPKGGRRLNSGMSRAWDST